MTAKYRKELEIDLGDLNVTPASVKLDVWDPMFVYLQQLPLPPTRRRAETTAQWIQRANKEHKPTDDVRWAYEPRYTRTTRERVYTGDPSCGRYFQRAMEVCLSSSKRAFLVI